MKRFTIYTFILLLPYLASAQFEEQISVKDATDAAYNIRTSGIKIVKDFVYSNMAINFANKEMDNSFSNSEDAILTLELYTKDKPEAQKTLNTIKALRKKGRMGFLRKPKKEQMGKMKKMLGKLLQLNNKLIKQIKASSQNQVPKEYELAKKIEVSIQQLTLLHALKAMGDKSEDTNTKTQKLTKGIGMMINQLMASKNNSEDTSYYLQLLKSDYDMFVKTLSNNDNSNFLNTLYVLSNKIGNMAHKIAYAFK